MAQIKCPKCGKNGTLIEKPTVTKTHGKTYTYKKLYVAHYLENGMSKHGKRVNRVQWCYLNQKHIAGLKARRVITQNPQNVTQNITQNKKRSLSVISKIESLGRDLSPRPSPYQGHLPFFRKKLDLG